MAVLVACRRSIIGLLRYSPYQFSDISPYNIAVVTPNYFDNGFIRRGLGGSITYLIDGSASHPASSLAIYQLIGAIFFAFPMALLLRQLMVRGDRLWGWFALVMLVSPQLFWGWSREPGRSDMIVCGFIAWSVLAALRGRFVIAALVLFVGSQVHETAVIYGTPMLVALWFVAWRQGKAKVSDGVVAVLLLAALLAAAALAQLRWGDDVAQVTATMRGARLVADHARLFDVAAYLTWGGFVAISTSWCMEFSDAPVPWVIAAGFVVLLVYFRVLFSRTWLAKGVLAFAALVPMVFMSAIAFDHGRWLIFAVANAWLAAVALRLVGTETVLPTAREWRISGALLVFLVLMGPGSSHYPSFLAEKLAPRLFPNNHPKWLADCAPDWAARLGPPETLPAH